MAIDPLTGIRAAIAENCPTPEQRQAMTLALLDWRRELFDRIYGAIAHGDDERRAWLKDKLDKL